MQEQGETGTLAHQKRWTCSSTACLCMHGPANMPCMPTILTGMSPQGGSALLSTARWNVLLHVDKRRGGRDAHPRARAEALVRAVKAALQAQVVWGSAVLRGGGGACATVCACCGAHQYTVDTPPRRRAADLRWPSVMRETGRICWAECQASTRSLLKRTRCIA